MLVAGSAQLVGVSVSLEEAPAPKLTRDYECSNAKLSARLGFIPRRSVVEAVADLLAEIDLERPLPAHRPALLQHSLAAAPPRGPAAYRGVRLGLVSLGRVLITGGGGQLASDLEELLSGRAEVVARDRQALDVTDDAAVAAAFDDARPDVVFNCAAFHNVEVCEREEDRSFEVNARAVKRLAERCAESGAKLVHMSTNYVFDGTSPDPYPEDDAAFPAQRLRALQAGRRVRGARVRAERPRGPRRRGSTACTAARRRAATSSRAWSLAPVSRDSSRWSPTSD